MSPIKIASWNVNSIKARQESVQNWLHVQMPNILFLQELKGETLPEISEKYHAVFIGQKAYNGVAILADAEVNVQHTSLPGDALDTQARFLQATYRDITLINLYLPNGNPIESEKFPYKLAWMERLYQHLKTLRTQNIPFLVGGDFNVIPEAMDCYDPLLWEKDALFHSKTREKFRALLGLGLTDALRVHNRAAGTYTFWDYQAGAWQRGNGIRIDHFLLSPPVTDRLISCTIDTAPRGLEKASDHTPIIVEIEG